MIVDVPRAEIPTLFGQHIDDIAVFIAAVDRFDLIVIDPDMTALDKALTFFADGHPRVSSVHSPLLKVVVHAVKIAKHRLRP